MNNLIISLNAVVPLFVVMWSGYFIVQKNMATHLFFEQLSRIASKIFMPILLFVNIYHTDLNSVFNLPLIMFVVVGILATTAAAILFAFVFYRGRQSKGALIQGFFRSNVALFALPLAGSLYGESALGVTSALIAITIPLFNALSVTVLSVFGTEKTSIKRIVLNILKNPLIIASLMGIFTKLLNIELPDVIETTLDNFAKVATTVALMAVGSTINFAALKKSFRTLVVITVGKLIVVPAIMLFIAVQLGFGGMEIMVILTMFATPVAVNAYTTARQLNVDPELAGQTVVATSACSVITIFAWVFLLKSLDML